MRKIYLLVALLLPWGNVLAEDSLKPEEIIKRFAAKEAEFREVWEQYAYTQKMRIEVLGQLGNVREVREIVLEVYFTNDGERKTRIISDEGQLSLILTKEDLSDAVELQPFVLTTKELPHYDIDYEGEEWVDEINTYVFDVEPKEIKKGKRYFKGRIWVDDLDFQIVKSKGKIVPDYKNNKFPEFETIRQQVDGEYWFPVWSKADDHLQFGSVWTGDRRTVHIREWITLDDFQKFEVGTSIQYGEVASESDSESDADASADSNRDPGS